MDLLVGLMIFATISIALLGMWGAYYRMMGKGRNTLVATNLAQDVMEKQIALGWQAQSVPPPNTITMEETIDSTVRTEVYNYWIDVVDNDPLNVGLKTVKVHVSWVDNTGQHEVLVVTGLYWGS